MTADRYRPIGDYAFLSDCHSVALVSREGSIDWCCMPRVDSASVFGRLLDADRGGFCAIQVDDVPVSRRYLDDGLVLARSPWPSRMGPARRWPSTPREPASTRTPSSEPIPAEEATMTIDRVRTRRYRLTCRRCHRTWEATYQVGVFHDDAGDHEVFFRGGLPATAPGSTTCPHCGGLRVAILPSHPE